MTEDLKVYLEQEKFYKDVVEDGSDVIFVVDFDLNILYHNPSVQNTIGYDSLVDQNFIDYVHPKVKKNFLEAFDICKSHPYNSNVEFKFLCGDDTYKYLEFNSINLKFKDGIEGLIFDCRDISERKKDQQELINAQKAKEQFLANMSHEIRTPINGIVGMVNLLSESATTVEQANYLNAIKNSADNLKVIINDILDFSIIEAGKLMLEKIGFNLNYQINSVIDSLTVQAKEKRLTIELLNPEKSQVVLLGDPVRLSQILINLINNAIKFTHKGKITIDVSCSEPHNNITNVTFKVIDTGIGIEKDKVKTIFETFKQADESITRKFGGTGLGLTISKQLVELQGGKISVSSELNVGTTFTFVIPYTPGKNEDVIVSEKDKLFIKPRKSVRSLAGMRVLLVEDNDINRMYAATILRKWHCELSEAENGQIALEKLRKQDYDLILMDIHMPILDGIEAARSIRTSFAKPKSEIPIIAFTANALKGDKDKYLDAGMNAYISKPFMPEELFTIMRKYYHADKNGEHQSAVKTVTNLTYLRKMSSNDESFVQDMVHSFIEKTPEIITKIKQAHKAGNLKEVSEMAHKLKPNLAFMGMESLKGVIQDIENNANKKKNIKGLPSLIKKLAASIDVAIKELDS